ncbi:MAG: hypothetical protein QM621_07555 [Aeromicrobium sp.]
MFWILLALLACWAVSRSLVLTLSDGHGDRPGPRSHAHEAVESWRA